MIKAIELVKARADRPQNRFHYHWRVVHGPLASAIDGFERYVQGHMIDPSVWLFPPSGYAGLLEAWFVSAEEIGKALNSEHFVNKVKHDEYNFADLEGTLFFVAEDGFVDPDQIVVRTEDVKAALILTRLPELTREAFVKTLRKEIAPRLQEVCPLISKVVVSETVPIASLTRGGPPDAILELWFDKLADYDASASRYSLVADLVHPLCTRGGVTSLLVEPVLKL